MSPSPDIQAIAKAIELTAQLNMLAALTIGICTSGVLAFLVEQFHLWRRRRRRRRVLARKAFRA